MLVIEKTEDVEDEDKMESIQEKKRISRSAWLIVLCWLVYTCSYLGKLGYNANITQIEADYRITHAQSGLVSTFFFVAYGVGQVVNGLLCKKYPLRFVVLGGLLLSGAMNLAVGFASSFAIVKYLWLINGAALSVLWPSLIRLLSETLETEQRGKAVLVTGTTVATGTLFVYGFSALFVALGAYKTMFFVAGVLLPSIAIIWFFAYPRLTGYNSISIYAFHPMYIDLRQLGKMKDKEAAAAFEEKRLELNALAQIDYEAVNNTKREYIRLMFQQTGKKVLASADFKKFFKENEHWLLPYAAFSHLRDQYGTPDFSQWPEHQTYDAKTIAAMCNPESECYEAIAYYYYIQYNLHIQLLEAGNYARQKGIIFKGDIPIGISRNSVEAWIEPYYFNMNGQAGAPPDAFSANGQNWGFPTYNWDVMEQDNYLWWQKRFRKMAEYFTAYRIDHILGFFRIWEIPSHSVHGLLGQFVPALPMGEEEIQSFGLNFQKDFMTRPFINDDILNRVFGEKADFVKETFLQNSHDDIWEMRPEYDTQRKVEAWFAGKKDEESVNMREGIYALISNVLFVPDRKNPSTYHPRITVQNDFIFERLSDSEKDAFNRLYNHYYYQRHNQFWYHEAMKKLPMLTQCTSMLVCGEDLGMVPDCVPWVMQQLQILSLEIQRMPKNPQHEFGHLWEYPLRSVCTISTHDMATLRGWWEEDPALTARYYNQVLGQWGEVPTTAPGWACEEIVRQHLQCPSLLCILAFQDWLSMDEDLRYPDANAERINVPANPRHYWRYRMHLTLEDLMKNKAFNQKMIEMIDEAGRY